MEICINQGEEVIFPTPSFLIYRILACKIGAVPVEIPLKSDFSYDMDMFLDRITEKTRAIILCNPNNPTGTVIFKKQLEDFMAKVPDGILIISDEAYNEYVENKNAGTAFPYFPDKNVIIARTFSKIYGLAGLRIGYGIAKSDITGFMERIRPPFNTTIPAQEAAIAALDDKDYAEKSYKNNIEGKRYLYSELEKSGIEYIPTEANFILCRFKTGAAEIINKLEKRGIIIRNMEGMGTGYARITIGTPSENAALMNALREVI
jgi:histidinol-phosphate aminotransferase